MQQNETKQKKPFDIRQTEMNHPIRSDPVRSDPDFVDAAVILPSFLFPR